MLQEAIIKSIETATAENGKLKSRVPKGTGEKIYLEPTIPVAPPEPQTKKTEEKSTY